MGKACSALHRKGTGRRVRIQVREPKTPDIWEFPKIRGYLTLGVLIITVLLFRVLY